MTQEQVYEMLKARWAKPKGRRELNRDKEFPYQVVSFNELRPTGRSNYLIYGVIPENGIVAVWGPPKTAKSFFIFDLVMHIALGWPYRGRAVPEGPVVYVAFEGADGFGNRAEAFRRQHAEELDRRTAFHREHGLSEEIRLYLVACNAKLVRDHKKLIESIHEQTDIPPVVVVLDTLNRSIDGSESKDVDMAAYLTAAEAIDDAFSCAVIIVHHSGINETRPRGHTSLTGAAAAQLSVKRDAAGLITVEVEAMKDGPEGATFTSALKLFELGKDEKGQPITSCAIVEVKGAAATAAAGAKARAGKIISPNQQRFLDILVDAILDAPPEHKTTSSITGGRLAVSREYLKLCCIAKGWVDDIESTNQKRLKVNNMINLLAGKRLIGATKLYVWDARH
jgi:hypothetical protein